MAQVASDEIEVAIHEGEIEGNGTLVANHAAHRAHRQLHGTNIGCLRKQFSSDKDNQEHLPHLEELCRDSCEAKLCHQIF